MNTNPASQRPEPPVEGHPVGIATHWGLSTLDAHAHAINENTDHPHGAYIARCGQRLVMNTSPHDEPPGWICLSCLRSTSPETPPRSTP